eukprot:TRINITY_DN8153_c0_g3_i3.p1 TRINITY_DN8153_c0_g3~~TRINITY_DN8153_c0_g3_i3.p1  ORF type:complete len:271 (-),score=29.93 TRINITY_DN8153_c0_g3_i3:117-929(-)
MEDTKGIIRGECMKCSGFCIEYNKNSLSNLPILNMSECIKMDICGICGCAASNHKEYLFTTRQLQAYKAITQIYSDYVIDDTFSVSLKATEQLHLPRSPFTYGEISLLSFPHLLSLAKPKKDDVFYDLGCGSAKPVLYAALLHDFRKCAGIELLGSLCDIAKKYADKYEDHKRSASGPMGEVRIVEGDFLKIGFAEADVVYVPATTFDVSLMKELARCCEKLKTGSRIITLGKPVPCITEDNCHVVFNIYKKEIMLMSWGLEKVFYQEKL